ncbi:hypothetical protein [Limisalsivibrio acetivorans]|uniref:hypothetical protein n=1 Tax=Limisalsivibrio acetivorans TaxID=1304888 RepID=UPI0003B33501|nr:hypothetical protein [Limisalsivibrio acetivorans]
MNDQIINGHKTRLLKGVITDLDIGRSTTSVTLQSGKRVLSALMPSSEALKSGIEQNREAFCMIAGRDVYFFRDAKEFFTRMKRDNPALGFDLVL